MSNRDCNKAALPLCMCMKQCVGSGLVDATYTDIHRRKKISTTAPILIFSFHSLFKQNQIFLCLSFFLTRVHLYSPSLRAEPYYLLKSSKRQRRRQETDCCSVCSCSLLLPHTPQEREMKTRMERKIERVCARFAFWFLFL